jgi:hypothetical protein
MRWFQRPGLPTVVSVFISVVATWVSQVVTNDNAMQIALGLLTGIAALQLSELWQMHARTPLVAELEQALTDESLYEPMKKIMAASKRIPDKVPRGHPCHRLFEERKRSAVDQGANIVEELANGRLVVSDPDQQFKFAIDLLALATKHVQAISFRDEDFWESEAGERYLDLNQKLVKREGEVERIFVLDSDESVEAWRPEIERHMRLGVKVYILPPNRKGPDDEQDFVIYDDRFVRKADPVEKSGSRKRATLSVVSVEVNEYRQLFQNLAYRSQLAEAYFAGLDARATMQPAEPPA